MAIKTNRNRKGFALILTVIIILFISITVLSLLHLIFNNALIVGNEEKFIQAQYLADAGIQDAIANLEKNKDWEPSDWNSSFNGNPGKEYPSSSGNGYNISNFHGSQMPGGNRFIQFTCNGFYNDIERSISITLSVTENTDGTIMVKVISCSD